MKNIKSIFADGKIVSLSTVPKKTPTPAGIDKDLADEELKNMIDLALNSLPRLKSAVSGAEVLRMYFGLSPYGKKYNESEIGNIYGISRKRVSQIKKDTIRKLRHYSRNKSLRQFLG
jgi:RNA polymerase primary sigma factor